MNKENYEFQEECIKDVIKKAGLSEIEFITVLIALCQRMIIHNIDNKSFSYYLENNQDMDGAIILIAEILMKANESENMMEDLFIKMKKK